MADLVRTLILTGLLSGTQPFTVMGLLLVMTGERAKKSGLAYIAGAFLVESAILVFSSFVFGNTVSPSSGGGRALFIIRTALGIVLILAGLRLRKPPKKPEPAIPKSLERVQGLTPGKAFLAGATLADYQGPFIGSLALAAADVHLAGRFVALAIYTVIATGIPLTIYVLAVRSRRAREKLNNSTNWVMLHRRRLASGLALILGCLLAADAVIGLLTN